MILVRRFEYPHVNDWVIARQRRQPQHRLVGSSTTLLRWPDLKRLTTRFSDRAGRKPQSQPTR